MGVFYFFSQYRVNHVHVTQDFKQVSYRRGLADGMKNLAHPVEQIQSQCLVMLRKRAFRNRIEELDQSFCDVRFVDVLNGLYERIVRVRD